MREYIAGIDIGGTKILTAILDREGRILTRRREFICAVGNPEMVMEQIAGMMKQTLAEMNLHAEDILATGVGTPGPLDFYRGVVEESPNLCWSSYPIQDELSKRLETKLLLDKDTNVAALGEKYFGSGQACPNFIYITISTGIGGAIIADGRLLHGQAGGAGELGHMVLEAGGRKCGCGRQGCLEALASGTALACAAQELIAQEQGRQILAFCDQNNPPTGREVGMAARQGDEEANDLINQAADYLGMAIANVVNIFNPGRVIIGGGMGLGLQDLLLPRIREYVLNNVFSLHGRDLQIEATQLGEDIVLLGCAAMVLNEELKGM